MKKAVLLSFLIIATLIYPASAELGQFWADTWCNLSYYQTNFENKTFSSPMLRFEGRFGVEGPKLWKQTTINPYAGAIVVWAQNDNNHWNNNEALGFGFRMYPLAHLGGFLGKVKLYAETLRLGYFKDAQNALYWPPGAAVPETKPYDDFRYGLDVWYEANMSQQNGASADRSKPWMEMWGNLTYRTTNFYQSDFNSYILCLQTKTGIFTTPADDVIGAEPYIHLDLNYSGRSYSWLNNAVYGIGVRISPFRSNNTEGFFAPALYKFKMYFEALSISYFRDQPAANTPTTDLRLGFDFTIGR